MSGSVSGGFGEFNSFCLSERHRRRPGRRRALAGEAGSVKRVQTLYRAPDSRQSMQHVLVVDHQPQLRSRVQRALEETGQYRVSCAGSGEQALPVLDRDRPNLVVLAIMMPGMPGIELAAHATQRGIPIIITTDNADLDARLSRLGWPYLVKPVRLEPLLDECRATIAETQENLRIIRASLRRLLATTGEIYDVVAELRALRIRVGTTLAESRRLRN